VQGCGRALVAQSSPQRPATETREQPSQQESAIKSIGYHP
jgi:hypothetical protein